MLSQIGLISAFILSLHVPSAAYAPVTTHGPAWNTPTNTSIHVIEKFSLPEGKYRAGHRGIDIQALPAAAIYAPNDGIVSYSGTVVDRAVITIAVSDELLITFEPVASDLRIGDSVHRGQQIGELQTGGHCSSECLHIGVRIHGIYMNPIYWFKAKPQLLPTKRARLPARSHP